jgi:hypothetical protein
MPRRKKAARDLTKDEAMKRLFPKEVREKLYEVAHGKDKDAGIASPQRKSTT